MKSAKSRKGWTTGSDTARNQRRQSSGGPNSGVRTVRQLLYWLSILTAVAIAFWNMQPYIKVSQLGLAEVLGGGTFDMIVWDAFLSAVGVLVGIILWALIQTAEVYPILLRHDRKVMRLMALEAENAEQLEIRDTDDPALERLKMWYNRFPTLSLRSASRASLLAYITDLVICFGVYPPVSGGILNLVFILVTGQFGQIDWANVGLIIVMLFCFEIMVRSVLFLGMQAYWFHRAHA
jgi:hypothetical protein